MDDKTLLKALGALCDAIGHLREDLHNHAILTRPEVFVAAYPPEGSRLFAVADMQPQTTAVVHKAYQNTLGTPVMALVHASPVASVVPPAGLVVEAACVMANVNGAGEANISRAFSHTTLGEVLPILLRPNEALFLSVMASAAITVTWHVVPLRGSRSTFLRET